ncbi:hypothetical protein [Microbacterium sp. NIBRBAC000506063]|uniref:hypothetical protein n=1 Tax=Microbacterium sp. NIBRBAC000506063 TaxID=2734618 RepID=UPI001BB7FD94|nr:hypothetical protein [Microbacterium sp. NIBRBAC000506063]QTV80765.1 hypothetical protein KAE78_15030 [Microbacterium sp. NIBRBAC000506063]
MPTLHDALGIGDGLRDGAYDFTQSVSPENPIGPLKEVTVRVPDELASAVPGYQDGHFLDAVTVSNVEYLGEKRCSVELGIDWADGAVALSEDELHEAFVLDTLRKATIDELSGPRRNDEFVVFSEDRAMATAQVGCLEPGAWNDSRGASVSFEIVFNYVTADAGSENRRLAVVPFRVLDTGTFFIPERINGMDQVVPHIKGWERGGGRWIERSASS